ncbi:MAG: hypothetical protein AAF696_32130 [Bacteroidota bacterium]
MNLKAVKNNILLLLSMFFLPACSLPTEKSEGERGAAEKNNPIQNWEIVFELNPEQDSAFEALNTLQVSTDEKNRLYSTFAGMLHACYPPDTSLRISQADFLAAMRQFITSNCKDISDEEADKLAASSVLAQEEYTLAICFPDSADPSYEKGIPRIGMWILPKVLGRRDIVLQW